MSNAVFVASTRRSSSADYGTCSTETSVDTRNHLRKLLNLEEALNKNMGLKEQQGIFKSRVAKAKNAFPDFDKKAQQIDKAKEIIKAGLADWIPYRNFGDATGFELMEKFVASDEAKTILSIRELEMKVQLYDQKIQISEQRLEAKLWGH